MRIIGFSFTKILAEKKEPLKPKTKIKMGMDISSIEKEKVGVLDQDVIRADFDFKVEYDKFALFEFRGNIYFTATPDKIKEVIKKWKDKKIPDEIRAALFNFVMTKCNIKALQFEEEFNLPSHIPLPKFTKPKPTDAKADYVK